MDVCYVVTANYAFEGSQVLGVASSPEKGKTMAEETCAHWRLLSWRRDEEAVWVAKEHGTDDWLEVRRFVVEDA